MSFTREGQTARQMAPDLIPIDSSQIRTVSWNVIRVPSKRISYNIRDKSMVKISDDGKMISVFAYRAISSDDLDSFEPLIEQYKISDCEFFLDQSLADLMDR